MTEAAPTSLLISEHVVLDAEKGGREVVPGWLRVAGATIEETGRIDRPEDRARLVGADENRGAEILDFGSRLISPAFVDAHTHLALGFLRGARGLASAAGNMVTEGFFRVEERLTAADVRAFVRMGAYESLLHGVGWVWDHYYYGEEVAEALLDVGLAGVVAPTLQDLRGPGRSASAEQLEATERIAASERHAGRGVYAALGPHATDTVSADLWRLAADTADRLELPLHAHVAQSVEEVGSARSLHGETPLGWLAADGLLEAAPRNLLVHALFVDDDDLERLDADRDHLAFCPHSQLLFAFPARPDRWEERGLDWVVGTDCSASNDSFNVQKELRFVAGLRTMAVSESAAAKSFFRSGSLEHAEALWEERRRHFTRFAAAAETDRLLDLVWRRPGCLHPAVRAGVLEPGALANVAVWDLDHPSFWPGENALHGLSLGDTTQALHAMMVAGRLVGTPGDFHRSLVGSVEYREARAEAEARRRRLLG